MSRSDCHRSMYLAWKDINSTFLHFFSTIHPRPVAVYLSYRHFSPLIKHQLNIHAHKFTLSLRISSRGQNFIQKSQKSASSIEVDDNTRQPQRTPICISLGLTVQSIIDNASYSWNEAFIFDETSQIEAVNNEEM